MNVSEASNTQVLVWRYGARKGLSIPPEVDEQLRLAHELREHLVDLAHERERAIAEVWAAHPEVATAQKTADEAQARLDGLLERAAQERQRGGKRTTSVDLRHEIAQARSSSRAAKGAVKAAKSGAYSSAISALRETRDTERKARRAAYAEYVQRQGLYWPTYNNVLRNHDVADRRIAAERKQGRPAQLRHHRYDGTGRLAVQIKYDKRKPKRSVGVLCTPGSPWWGVLRLPTVAASNPEEWAELSRAEQRALGRAAISVRARSRPDGSPVLWEIPVQIHRPIPPDAEITQVEVVITRVATERRVSVNLALRMPTTTPIDGPAVAVDIGWRAMPDGSLRVAYWCGSSRGVTPVRVPEHLTEVLRVDVSGREGEIRIPASWRQLDERISTIQSRRDKKFEQIKRTVMSHLKQRAQLAETLEVTPGAVSRWRAPGRMVTLAKQAARIDGTRELVDAIADWERQDRHLWRWEANERDQLLQRRRDAYRAAAAALVAAWPQVILEERFAQQFLRRPNGEHADRYQAEHARANARLAAPAEFAEALRNAATKTGGGILEFDAVLTTRRHHACGQELPAHVDPAVSTIIVCPHCGATFDQDQNAVMNMLDRRNKNTGKPRDMPREPRGSRATGARGRQRAGVSS